MTRRPVRRPSITCMGVFFLLVGSANGGCRAFFETNSLQCHTNNDCPADYPICSFDKVCVNNGDLGGFAGSVSVGTNGGQNAGGRTAVSVGSGGAVGSSIPSEITPGSVRAVMGIASQEPFDAIESWVGAKVRTTLTWNDVYNPDDAYAGSFTAQSTLKRPFGDTERPGILLNLIGGIWKNYGQTWEQAGSGADGDIYYSLWKQAIDAMRANWKDRDPSLLYVAFAREFNVPPEYINWRVESDESDAFIAAWRRFHKLLRTYLPGAKLVWCPKSGGGSDVPYPGSEYVDVIGTVIGDEMSFDDWLTRPGDGLLAIQAFAKAEGRTIGVCRWIAEKNDSSTFVEGTVRWLIENAGTAPGQVELGVFDDISCVKGDESATCNTLQSTFAKHLK